jgi:hypothetical protein
VVSVLKLDTETCHGLRTAIAESICAAQAQGAPRSRLQQMRYTLLCNALAALDPNAGVTPAFAIRIAVHALLEWRSANEPSTVRSV